MVDRSDSTVVKKSLAEYRREPFPEDLSATTTPEERIGMMYQLAQNAWAFRRVKPDELDSSLP